MYTLIVASDHAQLLGELAGALTRDQAYLDGLSRAPPASPPGSVKLLACKRDYKKLAEIALPPLTELAGDSTAERARLQTRHVLSLRLQRLVSSIDERLARGAPAVLRDLVDLEPPRLAGERGGGAPPTATTPAGTGETLAPPDCATAEGALLHEINHNIHMADLWFTVGRPASQALHGRLDVRERNLRSSPKAGECPRAPVTRPSRAGRRRARAPRTRKGRFTPA